MPARLSFILEWGTATIGNRARLAFLIRVSMSEIGSFIQLPTGLGDAGDQTVESGLAEGQARAAEFSQVTVAAAAHGAAVDNPHGAGVARQLGQTGVIVFGLQFGAKGRVLFH